MPENPKKKCVKYVVDFVKVKDETTIKEWFVKAMEDGLSVNITKIEATESLMLVGHKWE